MEKILGKRKLGETIKPRIAYPTNPPVEPFKSAPIVEIPDTLERPQFFSVDDFEEEKNKLYAMHIELVNRHEEKLRQGIMYLIDRIEWPTFYDQLSEISAIRDELRHNEATFRPIVQKWIERSSDITAMCISIIHLAYHQIEGIFDLLNKLQNFDDKRDSFYRRLNNCFSKYFAEKFDLFPCALRSVDKLKEREEWKRELDEAFGERINRVINETGHLLWAMTNEELVKVQLFYNTIRKDFVELEVSANSLVTVQREILNFDWPEDTIYNNWKEEFLFSKQTGEDDEVEDDDKEGSTKEETTSVINDVDKKDQ